MKRLVLILILCGLSQSAWTKPRAKVDLSKDFASLGDNQAIAEKAKQMDPNNKVSIVQNRMVDLNSRFELGINYGLVAGGDTNYRTQNLGANLDFHINPKWSVGLRYYRSYNNLTSEGEEYYQNARARGAAGGWETPALDYPIDTGLFVVNWYPIYGKFNFFDLGIAHFDIYTLAGYGKTLLDSGLSDTYTAGGGFGLWATQNIASRFEVRYQTYQDQAISRATFTKDTRQLDMVIFMASVGILL